MAKKKELGKLSLDMIECKKAGYGCHYGAWKATQDNPVKVKEGIPDGWLICKRCGKAFKPTIKRIQKYCDVGCQRQDQYERDRQKNTQYQRERRARLKERGVVNGQSKNAGDE